MCTNCESAERPVVFGAQDFSGSGRSVCECTVLLVFSLNGCVSQSAGKSAQNFLMLVDWLCEMTCPAWGGGGEVICPTGWLCVVMDH